MGELSVLDGSPRSTTVRPEGGPVRVLRIPGPSLRGTLLHRPRAAQSMLGILAGRPWADVLPGVRLLVAFDVIFVVVGYLIFEYVVEE